MVSHIHIITIITVAYCLLPIAYRLSPARILFMGAEAGKQASMDCGKSVSGQTPTISGQTPTTETSMQVYGVELVVSDYGVCV